jgi:palmitoyltransferase
MSPYTFPQLLVLFALFLTDFIIAFALIILFLRTAYNAIEGYTTIETWEQERHDALVRSKRVRRQQFPYDIGIWDNICSAFCGSSNILAWFWPLARTSEVGSVIKGSGELKLLGGIEWEVNGYEELGMIWPPPDPDKGVWVGKGRDALASSKAVKEEEEDWVEGVRRRQMEDFRRRHISKENVGKETKAIQSQYQPEAYGTGAQRPRNRWKNDEGETLADYGVDEDAEDEDEDVPLAELKRKLETK